MGSQQQFCLRWNNHQGNLVTVLNNLLVDNLLVDVTLACEGASLKAHKVVLSACSSFFQEIFVNNPCKHPVIILKDMKYSEMKAILQFMYKGEVNVSQDQLSALLKTAETLKVKGLAEVSSEQQDTQNKSQKQSLDQEHSDASNPRKQSNVYQPVHQRRQPIQTHVALNDAYSSSSTITPRRRRRPRSTTPPAVIATSSPKQIKEQPKSPLDITVHDQSRESEMIPVPDVYTNQPIPRNDHSMPDTSTFPSQVDHVDRPISPSEPEIVHIKEAPQSPSPESAQEESVLPHDYIDQNLSEMEGDHTDNIDDVLEKDITFEEQDSSMFSDQAMMAQYDDDESQSGMIYMDPGPSTSQGGIQQISNVGADNSSTDNSLELSYSSVDRRQCPICRKCFRDRRNMRRHYMAIHERIRFQCDVCTRSFSQNDNLQSHRKQVHRQNR